MSQTRWYQERSKEGYYLRAKKEGYRARSAYKLQQINEKYNVIREADAVADLGCAPGGWLQVLVEAVGSGGTVVGVDLQRIKPIPGAKAIQGDFTVRATHQKLASLLSEDQRKGLDCVVSDMAPDMSGNYDIDQFRSVHLSEMALDFATQHLREGGHFVCKVFEGADFQPFRNDVKTRFKSLYQYHPPASRKQSSEIYLVAKGFKGKPEEKKASKPDDEEPVNPRPLARR